MTPELDNSNNRGNKHGYARLHRPGKYSAKRDKREGKTIWADLGEVPLRLHEVLGPPHRTANRKRVWLPAAALSVLDIEDRAEYMYEAGEDPARVLVADYLGALVAYDEAVEANDYTTAPKLLEAELRAAEAAQAASS